MKFILLAPLVLALLPVRSQAQAKSPTTSEAVTLPTATQPATPVVSLGLKSNETIRTFSVTVQNDEEQALKVFGVQTTSGLYVVDFPRSLEAKGQATVTLVYLAKQNSTESADLLRLLTDRGEKVVQVAHDREQIVEFDTTSLQWQEGEKPGAKAVTFTMAPGTSVPKGVRVMGAENIATLEELGNGRYRISVTPGSTARSQQFPVFIQFVPAVPGAPAVISCAVVSKG